LGEVKTLDYVFGIIHINLKLCCVSGHFDEKCPLFLSRKPNASGLIVLIVKDV